MEPEPLESDKKITAEGILDSLDKIVKKMESDSNIEPVYWLSKSEIESMKKLGMIVT